MPRTNGIFSLVPSYLAVSGQTIRVDQHNPPLEDIAQALTDSLPRDGSAPMVGPLRMGGLRITNLAAATLPTDAARFDQITPYSPWLVSVSALSLAANELPYASGANTAAKTKLTPFARTLIDDENAETARNTLELRAGAMAVGAAQATWNAGTDPTECLISPAKLTARIDAHNGGRPSIRGSLSVRLHNGSEPIVAIDYSFGIAAVVRQGPGQYRVTMSTPMPGTRSVAINANVMRWQTGGYQDGNDNPLMIVPLSNVQFDVLAMRSQSDSEDIGGMMLTVVY